MVINMLELALNNAGSRSDESFELTFILEEPDSTEERT
jgi:hypothetical protein